MITKSAINRTTDYRKVNYYKQARIALFELLKLADGDTVVLLPDYIGYSPREGSGVFDPVIASGLKYDFYRLDRQLHVDIEDFTSKCKMYTNHSFTLIIHYFGYVDPNYSLMLSIIEEYEGAVIEDCAHALYTSLVDGKCGGDCSIYSLHKMLPMPEGAMLMTSNARWENVLGGSELYDILSYDLNSIAQKRKRNAEFWDEALKDNDLGIEILRTVESTKGQTPQSFPIINSEINRDEFYIRMNECGFGTVSLYHTLIEPLRGMYTDSEWVSQRISNLPVHQDITGRDLVEMLDMIIKVIKGESI